MSRSLNDRVNDLLADLARECMSWSQHRPVDGSVLLAETAGDDRVGSAALPRPFGFAHVALRGLVPQPPGSAIPTPTDTADSDALFT